MDCGLIRSLRFLFHGIRRICVPVGPHFLGNGGDTISFYVTHE